MKKSKILIIVGIAIVALISVVAIVLGSSKKSVNYIVTFDTGGGTIVNSQTIKEGEKVNKPIDPQKEGYVFIEWLYNDESYDFNSEVKTNLKLVASWKEKDEKIETFVVKFNSDGGTTISNQFVDKGSSVKKPNNPTKKDYEFKYWMLNNKEYDFTTPVSDNIVLKAKWEKVKKVDSTNNNSNQTNVKKYTVTFDSNGGSSVASQTVESGKKASMPGNPTRSGYAFKGWTLNGNSYNFDTKVTSNIKLVATWEEVIKNKYTVTFDSNGGSSVSNQVIEEGSKAVMPGNPTRSGYTFTGWTLNGSSYNFDTQVTGNIVLVATWAQKSYAIKLIAVDDYSPARILEVYEDGSKITVSEIKYSDGTHLCSGDNPNVNKNAVLGETSFVVVLNDGTQVTAVVN